MAYALKEHILFITTSLPYLCNIKRTYNILSVIGNWDWRFLCYCGWKLQVAKGKSAPSVSPQPPFNNTSPPASEWRHVPELPAQQYVARSSTTAEKSGAEALEDASAVEDEGDPSLSFFHLLPSFHSTSLTCNL